MFRSPVTGRALTLTGHALANQDERWPVVDGIGFLRADRRALADSALAMLDSGDAEGALTALLGDQDGWANTPPPSASPMPCSVGLMYSLGTTPPLMSLMNVKPLPGSLGSTRIFT